MAEDDLNKLIAKQAGIDERHADRGPPYGRERRDYSKLSTPDHRGESVLDETANFLPKAAKIWAAASVLIVGMAAVVVHAQSLETKEHADVIHKQLRGDIDNLKDLHEQDHNVLSEILANQKESQELQLMEHLQRLQDRLSTVKKGTDIYDDYLQQQNEAAQKLSKVRREMRKGP